MTQECLIVFTRHPEPGKTKTRLIPALGAEGAATLYRQMAEHILAEVRELQSSRSLAVEVHFTGGSQKLMQDWLGSDIVYQQQTGGDLGVRMAGAFESAFTRGIEGAVIIGTDCPSLDASAIAQAFDKLSQHDLVLGPALDGGYYLIGLRRLIPELFTNISWSTSEVLRQTADIADSLGLAVAYLSPLADIDRPEDLLDFLESWRFKYS